MRIVTTAFTAIISLMAITATAVVGPSAMAASETNPVASAADDQMKERVRAEEMDNRITMIEIIKIGGREVPAFDGGCHQGWSAKAVKLAKTWRRHRPSA